MGEDRRFVICVDDSVLHAAMSREAALRGWEESTDASSGSVMVTNSVERASSETSRRVVLVVEATPFASSAAIASMLELRNVNGVVAVDGLGDLAPALDAVAANRALVSTSVLDRAACMPVLSQRQLNLVAALIAGCRNGEIACQLNMSPASVKRELADLYRICGVANRLELATYGVRLGLRRPCPAPL